MTTIGISTPRAQSPSRPRPRPPLQRRASSQPPPTKSVKFNLGPSSPRSDSPTHRNRHERAGSSKQSRHDGGYDSEDAPRKNKSSRRHRRASTDDNARAPSPTSSDSTVDLPNRFDTRGRRITEHGEDPVTDRIQELFGGSGSVGKFLQSLTGGGGDDDDSEVSDRDRRKRKVRRPK